MTIIREHTQHASFSGDTVTINWTGPLAEHNLLVAVVQYYQGGVNLDAPHGQTNVTWIRAGDRYYNNIAIAIFYAYNIPDNAGTSIEVYRSSTAEEASVIISEYSGIQYSSDPLDLSGFHDGTNAYQVDGKVDPNFELTSAAGDLVICGIGHPYNSSIHDNKTYENLQLVDQIIGTSRSNLYLDNWKTPIFWPRSKVYLDRPSPVGLVTFKANNARANPVKRICVNSSFGHCGGSPFSFNLDVTPEYEQTIILGTNCDQNRTITGVSQTGVTWEKITHTEIGSGESGIRAEAWIGTVGRNAGNTISVATSNNTNISCAAIVYDNLTANGLAVVDVTKTNTGTNVNISTGNTSPTIQANEVLVAFVCNVDGNSNNPFYSFNPTNDFACITYGVGGCSPYKQINVLEYAAIQADVYHTEMQQTWNETWASILVGLKCKVNMEKVTNPSPINNAIDIDTNTKLSWDPDPNGESYDVYFGTNAIEVSNGTGGTYQGEQTEYTYDPSPWPTKLDNNTTYYWKITVKAPGASVPGDIWQFTTADQIEYATNIKYNIYYSTNPNKYWTLSNTTPLNHSELGNKYSLTGLNSGTLYYVTVIAGEEQAGIFYPHPEQVIGNSKDLILGPFGNLVRVIQISTTGIRIQNTSSLAHSINVTEVP